MESLPAYVSIVFILTTLAAVAFLLRIIKAAGEKTFPYNVLIFLLPTWLIFTGIVSIGGFYQITDSFPPRLMLFGILPAILVGVFYFVFFRKNFIDRMPLKLLTLLHIVRIPVELVLLWLFFGGAVPQVMTFEGWNYDILSGVLALIVGFLAFRNKRVNRPLLIAFNLIGLILLVNIVAIALLSLPTPVQRLGFDQPNIAILYFPYIWLPTVVVPIVFFSHLASIWKLIGRRDR